MPKPQKLSDLITDDFINHPKYKLPFRRGMVLSVYGAVFSKVIGSKAWLHTVRGKYLQDRKDGIYFIVEISNPAVRQELHLHRVQLLKALNKRLGMEVVKGVVVRS